MKYLKYLIFGSVLALGTTSCQDWLDVNVDPDNPNNESIVINNRLPYIQRFYMYSAGVTNFRTSCLAGVYYSNNGTNNTLSTTWACAAGATTTSYQTWFVGAAANLNDLYNKAEAEGAYHFMAAADVMHAMGFMEMLDLYGEIPYSNALSETASPSYDTGRAIYEGCIAKLDEAIELFGRTQEAGAPSLSQGDLWNDGDVNKWIKLCYGLKARYLLKLSKKSDMYDPDAILECLNNAPQSIDDNVLATCYNTSNDVTDYLLGDPFQTNTNWDSAAYGSNQRISDYFRNLLVNMRNAGVIDPRMEKIVPASMCNVKLGADGKVRSNDWFRSLGVDSYGEATRLVKGGATSIALVSYADAEKKITYTISDAADRAQFIADMEGKHPCAVNGEEVTVTYGAGSIFVDNENYIYAGDTAYVNLRSGAMLTTNSSLGEMDVNWYPTTAAMTAGVVASTGSFQTRPVSDFEVLTYHEMCFIKAEVLMRKGDKDGALAAYKAGIKAHMDMMQSKLTEWQAAGYDNPDMWPMDNAAITEYLNSDAVCQDAASLTMSDIMLQKMVAMGCSIENWNDMRRFNFSAGNIGDYGVVYPGYGRGPLFSGQAQVTGTDPNDLQYWVRRFRLPATLELSYNTNQALAANANALATDIWCYPVWWDCSTDEEYNAYLK